MNLDHSLPRSRPKTLPVAQINLYVGHIVDLLLQVLFREVDPGVEDNVAWLHFLLFQHNGKSVELVGLVAAAKLEAELVL